MLGSCLGSCGDKLNVTWYHFQCTLDQMRTFDDEGVLHFSRIGAPDKIVETICIAFGDRQQRRLAAAAGVSLSSFQP